MIKGLNHFNIATADLEKSAVFYETLGLRRGHRPSFSTSGVWLYAGDGEPIIHLNDEAEVGPIVKGTGCVHHIGLAATGSVEEICALLSGLQISYDLWPPIPGVCRALYFKGPSGEAIEFVMVDCFVPRIAEPDRLRDVIDLSAIEEKLSIKEAT